MADSSGGSSGGGSSGEGAAVGGQLGGAIGDLIGYYLAQGDYQKAEELRQQAMQQYQDLKVPNQFDAAPNSAFQGYTDDPATKTAQLAALQQLQGLAAHGGMDAQMQSQLDAANANAAGYEQGQRGAILQRAAETGTGGSGLQYASELEAQQGGANRDAMSGANAAAAAQQRALQAIQASGQLGGDIRSQDFNQFAAGANAQDSINKFNAANQNQFNQNAFQDAYERAGGIAGGYMSQSQAQEEEARRKMGLAGGIGQGVGASAGYGADLYSQSGSGGSGGGASSIMSMFGG